MIISSERTMALYCPACESVQYHAFSVFEITENSRPFQCKCGFTQGHITKKGRKFEVRLLGPLGDPVRMLYSAKEFWTSALIVFVTPQDGDELGFFGSMDQVEAAVSSWQFNDLPIEEFVEPDVMYAILARLQKLADKSKVTCECEKPSVGIDVYPDRVELVCSFCGSAMLMRATTIRDAERVQRLSEIVMERSAHKYLDEWLRPFV